MLVRKYCLIIVLLISTVSYSQKSNRKIDLKKSEYILFSDYETDKGVQSANLKFVNTNNATVKTVPFPDGHHIRDIQQILIEPLEINLIFVQIQILNIKSTSLLNNRIIFYSTDGSLLKELNLDGLSIKEYVCDEDTGRFVLFLSENTNEKTRKTVSKVFDLKTFQEVKN